jgi:NAD+ diphosphatase
MSFSFTARLPLSRHAVDRDNETRSRPGLFEELWADADTRVLVLWRGSVLLAPDPGAPRLLLLEPRVVPEADVSVYLGRSLAEDAAEPVGTRLVLTVVGDETANALEPDPEGWASLRALATTLSDRDAGLFTEALGLANWHLSHTHCPRCGAQTTVESAGWSRLCPVDGSQIFPRTDPAVIVLITDADDRILLGSNALWEGNRYSLLAGFVEPGGET